MDEERWFGGAPWDTTTVEIVVGAHKRVLALEVIEARLPGLDGPYPRLPAHEIVERWVRAARAGLWGSPVRVEVRWIGAERLVADVEIEGVHEAAFTALGWLAHVQGYGSFRCVEKAHGGLVSARGVADPGMPSDLGFDIEVGEGGDGGDDLAVSVELSKGVAESARLAGREILTAWGDVLAMGAFVGRSDEPLSHGYPASVEEPYENELLLRVENAQWEPLALAPLMRGLQELHRRTGAVVRVDA
jgi:hypothetical protein